MELFSIIGDYVFVGSFGGCTFMFSLRELGGMLLE